MIFDSHAHYDDEQFEEDREALLSSFKEQGVGYVVNISASLSSVEDSIELAKEYPFIYTSVGVHPEEVHHLKEDSEAYLRKMADYEKCVAIGEIGLDYHRKEVPHDLQKKWFITQMDIARDKKLPILIHSRDAAQDTLNIMREQHAEEIGGVIHCFSYSKEMAAKYLEMGFYLGIGGVVTFKNAKTLKEVVEYAPLESLLLETDCPYLAPEPYRGKRNNSLYIKYVAEQIAQLKGVTYEEVVSVTEQNAKKMYGI
ncbi:MAG: TatD family hydrolase [Lachnospiraceae bacterium]|nr:TatD family hydrolase [Lachnospiraceae bacterium]